MPASKIPKLKDKPEQDDQVEVQEGEVTTEDNNDGTLVFDLKRIIIPIRITEKDGTLRKYELKEATSDVATHWRNSIINKTKIQDGKAVGLSNVADSEPLLVSMCLFRAEGKKDNVKLEEVRSWPSRIVKSLFEKAKEISDLDEDEDDNVEAMEKQIEELQGKLEIAKQGGAAKNEQDLTLDG